MAKTISCEYKNDLQLHKFIIENKLHEAPHLLVQVFSGLVDKKTIEKIQQLINEFLPSAAMIGCTTSGEIVNGNSFDFNIMLSFTSFEKTEIDSFFVQPDDYRNSYEAGKSLAERLISSDTRMVLLFAADFSCDVQSLLEGIYEKERDFVIAGGVSGDNGVYKRGYVFTNKSISATGVVAASLRNKDLEVQLFSNHKWQELARPFTVTKSNGTIIHSIEGKSPLELIKFYLGENFISRLPLSGWEIPFVFKRGGETVPIFITRLLNNGAIEVNRSVKEGEKIVFAHTHLEKIMENSMFELERLSKAGAETIFIYDGMARKNVLGNFVNEEIKNLNVIAPVAGFYSYGEIAHGQNKQPQLVGHSLTYAAISENKRPVKNEPLKFSYSVPKTLETVISLTRLMEASKEEIRILNERLTVSEQHYRSLFDNNSDIVYTTDLFGNLTSVNRAFEEVFGYRKEEVIGRSALDFIKNGDTNKVRRHFLKALRGKEQHYDLEILSKLGQKYYFQLTNVPITVNEKCIGIYGIGRNITEQKRNEEQIMQLAYYDQDTGLPNRLKFTEKLREWLERAKRKNQSLAVMVIDLDRFKIINDSLGHFAGDQIIKEVCDRIQKVLPLGSYFGRFSGDKFNIVLTKNVSREEAMKTANSILASVGSPLLYAKREFFVTASIGISFFPKDGIDEITLIKNADIAMNRSKRPGGNRVTLYSTEMNSEALERLEFESYLRKALQKNEFFLCYQPLVDLETCRVYGSEALIRWQHPKLGLVPPGEFIPLAEETGLIEEIGKWVLATACKQNKKWQEMGHKDLSVAVNVSAIQFQQHDFLDVVKGALRESGLEAKFLTLELTESTMLRNLEYSIHVMEALQQLGVKVSIDDFGTGYSSLSYLKDLPINTLKIDRSFINNLKMGKSDIAIVRAIITMGRGLAVKVVAEGVETKEQIELLKELECHYAQGFYIYKPLMSEQFEEKLLKTV